MQQVTKSMRAWSCWGQFTLMFFCLAGASILVGQHRTEKKKGVGDTYFDTSLLSQLNVGWYYTWTPTPRPGRTQAEFVPMIWSHHFVKDDVLQRLKNAKRIRHLLGFNEPENTAQANMSVEEAMRLWPKLMATGLRLGSPGVSNSPPGLAWLDAFMHQVEAYGYRVDFVCVHWYGDITTPHALASLKRFLTRLHEAYNRPIWLTEFSGGNWPFIRHKPMTLERNAAFVGQALPMLEQLDFLERYAWFATYIESDPLYQAASLFAGTPPQLTVVGKAYRQFQ